MKSPRKAVEATEPGTLPEARTFPVASRTDVEEARRRVLRARSLDAYTVEVRKLVKAKGWDAQPVPLPQAVAMLHSEVTEILEAWRVWDVHDATRLSREHWWQFWRPRGIQKPEGMGSECADVFIRLLDTCDRFGIDLPTEFTRKMDYNWTRPYRWSKI